MTRATIRGAALVLPTLLLLTGCTAGQDSAPPAPRSIDALAPRPAEAPVNLPAAFRDAVARDPGWNAPPQLADDVYVGLRDTGGALEFSAVDHTGRTLWSAERPRICSGYVVSTAGEGAVAVLMDLASTTTALSAPRASAYDLRTGRDEWGPVDVPGPHRGPGLVFAAPPRGFIGDAGARVALDPATGTVLADERELDGESIVGEYDGVAVIASDDEVRARTVAGEAWSLSLSALGWADDDPRAGTVRAIGEGRALFESTEGSGTVVDLHDGRVVATGVRGAMASSDVTIALTDRIVARDRDGILLWERPAPQDATLVSAGRDAVYVRGVDGVHALDPRSGAAIPNALPARAASTLPHLISDHGAAIVGPTDAPILLAVADAGTPDDTE